MALDLDITPARVEDARDLAEVMIRAMETHMIDRFMVPGNDFQAAYHGKINWFLGEFGERIKDPSRRLFKASIKDTGEIVAFGAIQYHDGVFESVSKPVEETPDTVAVEDVSSAPVIAALPTEKKPSFMEYYFGELKAMHAKHMRGTKHVVWTTLHVKPSFQGKGVGGTLLRWGFREFHLEKELVWLNTQMLGRNIYRRFGWEDKDHLDVDLSEWGGKLRGFGIHRTPFMLRQPGEFKKLDGFIDE